MQDKSITILSSRGRGISADLVFMRTHLVCENDMSHVVFRSFSQNEKSGSAGVVARMRRKFCENAMHVLCVDGSLSGKGNFGEGCRLLLASPYEYQFKNAMASGRLGTFKNYTHIIAGSPFTEKLLKQCYELDGINVIGQTALPLAWEICQAAQQEKARERIAFYFPEVREKKVMFLQFGKKSFFEGDSLQNLLDSLGDSWFVVTNSRGIVEDARALPLEYRTRFASMNGLMQTHELLFVTDVLVTDNGRMAASFSSRGKPVYCPLSDNSSFERYMKTFYRELCIANEKELLRLPLEGELSSKGRKFCHEFSYSNAGNPYQKTAEIFGLKPGNGLSKPEPVEIC